MIPTPTSGIPSTLSEEQQHIHMIQISMWRIAVHSFNAFDDITNATSEALIFDTAYTHRMEYNPELFYDDNQFPMPIIVHRIASEQYLAYE
jgi:hypothetical protein